MGCNSRKFIGIFVLFLFSFTLYLWWWWSRPSMCRIELRPGFSYITFFLLFCCLTLRWNYSSSTAAVVYNLFFSWPFDRFRPSLREWTKLYQNGIKIEVIILMTTFDKYRRCSSCIYRRVPQIWTDRFIVVVVFLSFSMRHSLFLERRLFCYCNYLFGKAKIKADIFHFGDNWRSEKM